MIQMIQMNLKIGAVAVTIISLIVGISLKVPSETDVAETTIESIQDQMEPDSPVRQVAQNAISVLELLGVAIIISSLAPVFAVVIKVLAGG